MLNCCCLPAQCVACLLPGCTRRDASFRLKILQGLSTLILGDNTLVKPVVRCCFSRLYLHSLREQKCKWQAACLVCRTLSPPLVSPRPHQPPSGHAAAQVNPEPPQLAPQLSQPPSTKTTVDRGCDPISFSDDSEDEEAVVTQSLSREGPLAVSTRQLSLRYVCTLSTCWTQYMLWVVTLIQKIPPWATNLAMPFTARLLHGFMTLTHEVKHIQHALTLASHDSFVSTMESFYMPVMLPIFCLLSSLTLPPVHVPADLGLPAKARSVFWKRKLLPNQVDASLAA